MMKHAFSLGEVLTVTTGRLLCPIGGAYKILNYLTGESLFTHQIPRAMDACRPYVLEMFPPLRDVNPDGVNNENWRGWLAERQKEYGDLFPLAPMHEGRYLAKDPIEELREMVPDEKIIEVRSVRDLSVEEKGQSQGGEIKGKD